MSKAEVHHLDGGSTPPSSTERKKMTVGLKVGDLLSNRHDRRRLYIVIGFVSYNKERYARLMMEGRDFAGKKHFTVDYYQMGTLQQYFDVVIDPFPSATKRLAEIYNG